MKKLYDQLQVIGTLWSLAIMVLQFVIQLWIWTYVVSELLPKVAWYNLPVIITAVLFTGFITAALFNWSYRADDRRQAHLHEIYQTMNALKKPY
jgi:hypothetical protein